jgi:excisionase family DNA binding protein
MSDNRPKYLSAKEFADEIDVHRETLYRMIKRGDVPGARKVGGSWRIPEWALDEIGEPAHLVQA